MCLLIVDQALHVVRLIVAFDGQEYVCIIILFCNGLLSSGAAFNIPSPTGSKPNKDRIVVQHEFELLLPTISRQVNTVLY